MSLQIIRAGLLDTIQDGGRYGFQHLGVNPSGVMDPLAHQQANALLGKPLNAPVLEVHFPAPQIRFTQPAVICITGADFTPFINGTRVENNRPVVVQAGTELKWYGLKKGACAYIAFLHDFDLEPWLGSYSTHLRAHAGGFKGRALQTGDIIDFKPGKNLPAALLKDECTPLPWFAESFHGYNEPIQCIIGNEWHWLTDTARENFMEGMFQLAPASDRMGFRINGKPLEVQVNEQLISSPVSFGTVQLLPEGQLIILMADHQTAGGYPRIAQVVSHSFPALAQKRTNEQIVFTFTDLASAQEAYRNQQKKMRLLQNACIFRIEKLWNASL